MKTTVKITEKHEIKLLDETKTLSVEHESGDDDIYFHRSDGDGVILVVNRDEAEELEKALHSLICKMDRERESPLLAGGAQ